MLLQKQTITADLFAHTSGDCFRAVVATLMNMNMMHVPHFYEEVASDMPGNEEDVTEQWIDTWLRLNGVARIRVAMPPVTWDQALELSAHYSPTDHPSILSGLSHAGTSHCVIVQNGKMIWDPAPGAEGLAGPYPEDYGWLIEWIIKPLEVYDASGA